MWRKCSLIPKSKSWQYNHYVGYGGISQPNSRRATHGGKK
jgi:hypothetical protein